MTRAAVPVDAGPTPIYDALVTEVGIDPAFDAARRRTWHYVQLWGGTSRKRTDDLQRRANKALAALIEAVKA